MSAIIKVENLGKKYTIRHEHPERYVALRDVMAQKAKKLFSFPKHLRSASAKPDYEDFWALKDLNFEINQGDRVGIIGRNGAGKSTLLKILSRITEPSTGRITLNGRVASLLEVGTGFHPELTGRENIFLNGAILGMGRAEIRKKFDEIVDFSGVEKFLDTPVKRYSSGMYVRLAFAVAAHLEPEILVVDEVLAVGDAEFQKKSMGKMEDISKNLGRTVIFVSHSMAAISNLCNKALLLNQGKLLSDGNVNDVIKTYLINSTDNYGHYIKDDSNELKQDIYIKESWIEQNNIKTSIIVCSERLSTFIKVKSKIIKEISIEILIRDTNYKEIIFIPLGLWSGFKHELKIGENNIQVDTKLPILACGKYFMDLIVVETGIRRIETLQGALSFTIESTYNEKTSWSFDQSFNVGSILLPATSQLN